MIDFQELEHGVPYQIISQGHGFALHLGSGVIHDCIGKGATWPPPNAGSGPLPDRLPDQFEQIPDKPPDDEIGIVWGKGNKGRVVGCASSG
jgi:hypothetical protein